MLRVLHIALLCNTSGYLKNNLLIKEIRSNVFKAHKYSYNVQMYNMYLETTCTNSKKLFSNKVAKKNLRQIKGSSFAKCQLNNGHFRKCNQSQDNIFLILYVYFIIYNTVILPSVLSPSHHENRNYIMIK